MELSRIVQDHLPPGLPTSFALLTMAAATAPFLVPTSWLPVIQLPSEGQLGILRVVVSLLLLLVGSFTTFAFVLHHYTRGKGADEIAKRILKIQAEQNRQRLAQDAYFRRMGQ